MKKNVKRKTEGMKGKGENGNNGEGKQECVVGQQWTNGNEEKFGLRGPESFAKKKKKQ